MDGLTDTLVSAAAADISAHEVVDVGVGGLWFFRKQRNRGHDLPGLAIAALRNVFLDPGPLHGMVAVGGQAFNRGDSLAADAGDGRNAGARRFAVDVHSAGSAQRHTASEFRPGHIQDIAQHPEQRHIRTDIRQRLGFSIQLESDGHGVLLRQMDILQQSGID